MAGPALMAGLALFAVNWIGRGKASISPYGSVFLAARVLYDGPGLAVAQRECPDIGWKLCAVLDRLPRGHNSFLWDEDSPLWTQLGGAREWAPEASALVSATLRQAPGAMLAAALRNTVEQLQSASLGDGLEAWPPPVGPVPVVARFYPNDLAALQASLQQTGYLQAEAQHLVPLQMAVLLATAASLAWLVRRIPRRNAPAGALVALVLASFIGNAAITGALSGPTDRYQSRIIWLLPFTAAALLASLRPALGSSSISLEPGIPDQSHS
jgi:hypothetical protein